MSTKFLSPGWRMPRNANQSKSSNYSLAGQVAGKINISSPATVDITASFSFWLKRPDITHDTQPYGIGTNYGMYMFDTNGLYIRYGAGHSGLLSSTALQTALASTDWVHWVIIREEVTATTQNLRIYANNVLVESQNNTSSFGTGNSEVNEIMRVTQDNQDIMNNFAIFDYALSASQVATLYGTGSAIGNPMALPSPPIAYYPLGTSAWNGQYLAENNAIGDYVFDFDGSNYIATGATLTNLSVSTSFSISCWVKITSNVNYYHIVGAPTSYSAWNTGFGLYTNGSGIRFWVEQWNGENQFVQTSSLNNGQWYHIGATFDTTNGLKLYVNAGTPTTATGTTIDGLSNTIFIGSTGTNTTYAFSGDLSNTQIWNTELSSSDIETLYNNGSPIRTLANIPQSSNLKAWYKLDASEVYNNTTTEWSIDNNQNPSAYASSLDFGTYTSNDRIIINNTFDTIITGTNFTISSWVNLNSVTSSQLKFIFTNESLQFVITDKITTYLRGASGYFLSPFSGNTTLTTGKWYNVVLVKSGSDYTYYLNGSPDGTVNNSTAVVNSSQTTSRIGMFFQNNTYGFDGKLSNVQIFNSALPATGSNSVETLYNNGSPLASMSGFTSLVSWWKLNNTTTGIEDAKGSNNGTNNGATEYTGFVNTLAGDSSGMSQANLVQSDLQTVAPYSKYAMEFDASSGDYIDCGRNTNLDTGDLSASIWINKDSTGSGTQYFFNTNNGSSIAGFCFLINNTNKVFINRTTRTKKADSGYINIGFTEDAWHHLCFTYNDTSGAYEVYFNGNSVFTITASAKTNGASQNITIGENSGLSGLNFDGKLSNASIWNTALTSAQVTEIYNQGLPGNLNSHSAYSNLVSWWQLGENSSFDGNDWIVADEKGTNNGTSTGMPVGALVNGVGTTANGLSSGMSEGNLVGDAPYSTANALSTNMVVTSRVSGSGNTP